MSAAALNLPASIGRIWYKVPLGTDTEPGQDKWPSAARQVFRFISWRLRSGSMSLDDPDRVIAAWLGIKRRTVQKGLEQLEGMGEITRHRQHGRRVITLATPFKGPPAKPKKGPRKPATAPATVPTAPPGFAPIAAAAESSDDDLTPEEIAKAEAFKARGRELNRKKAEEKAKKEAEWQRKASGIGQPVPDDRKSAERQKAELDAWMANRAASEPRPPALE
jgi:hypothetical protein